MMIVCIENRIPLFLVGKPGSSKSLSKAMVVDAMKGAASNQDLFRKMKRVSKSQQHQYYSNHRQSHLPIVLPKIIGKYRYSIWMLILYLFQIYMVSFQCSRHATPAGIVGVFNHCAKFQKDQDLDAFVSVVVLDEVGLAEDSENMPLKVRFWVMFCLKYFNVVFFNWMFYLTFQFLVYNLFNLCLFNNKLCQNISMNMGNTLI